MPAILSAESHSAPVEKPAADTHSLLVIDHHEARIFQFGPNGEAQEAFLPAARAACFRWAAASINLLRGVKEPVPGRYYEPIVRALPATGRILIFGCGTEKRSEMDQFVLWLRTQHPALASRILDAKNIDQYHLVEGQLLAYARDYFLTHQETRS